VESSCEFGIEPSGSINAGKLSSGPASSGLSSSAQLRYVFMCFPSFIALMHDNCISLSIGGVLDSF
jgi:hypothetical protein